jgi:hypothetical protein
MKVQWHVTLIIAADAAMPERLLGLAGCGKIGCHRWMV